MLGLFSGDALSVIEKALAGRGWKYKKESDGAIQTGISSKRDYFIVVHAEKERKTAVFLFVPLDRDDKLLRVHVAHGHSREQVAGVCEIITHLNFSALLGCLARDFSDGELRFRIAVPYRDTSLTVDQVNWCLDVGVGYLDSVVPKIERYLGGRLSLEEAIGEKGPTMEV